MEESPFVKKFLVHGSVQVQLFDSDFPQENLHCIKKNESQRSELNSLSTFDRTERFLTMVEAGGKSTFNGK